MEVNSTSLVSSSNATPFNERQINRENKVEKIINEFKFYCQNNYNEKHFTDQFYKVVNLERSLTNEQRKSIAKNLIKIFPSLDETDKQHVQGYFALKKNFEAALASLNEEQFQVIFSGKIYRIKVCLSSKEIDLQKLSHLLQIVEKLFPDKELSIKYASTTNLSAIFLSQYGKNIKTLDLKMQRHTISDKTIIRLLHFCPNIHNLSISSDAISNSGINALNSFKNLSKLGISGCQAITDVRLNKLTKLKRLDLQFCKDLKMVNLSGLTNLKELYILGCPLTSVFLNKSTKLSKL